MYDVIVIGAGPSGMMASITAAKNQKKVLLLEKNHNLGKKLLITGGGRCNLTNFKDIKDFSKEIPVNHNFLKYSLYNFGPNQIYDYFSNLGVDLKIEDDDRVFPVNNKASSIVEALQDELYKYKVAIKLNCTVFKISNKNNKYIIDTNNGSYEATNIVVATGSKSFPQTGSSGDGYEFAGMLNQPLTDLYPSQAPLKLVNNLPLAGMTLDNIAIKLNDIVKTGPMLFTHSGISGPVVFKISEYVYQEFQKNKEVSIDINFLPSVSESELFELLNTYEQRREIKSFMRKVLPSRLADYILDFSKVKATDNIAVISNSDKKRLISNVVNLQLFIKNKFSIENSFITGGGIDIKYINKQTMESTINPGLYFVGELLDIHGSTGGYNITIALATGYIAGISIK